MHNVMLGISMWQYVISCNLIYDFIDLCSCPNLWSSLESDLGPGEPIVNLCASPDYIDTSCKCQSLQNDATCVVSPNNLL